MGEQKANLSAGNLALASISSISEPDYLPSGIRDLEFSRGAISEIVGPPSSGRATIAYSTLAQATRRGEACAVVDALSGFDPVSASESGVRLEQLLWIRAGGNLEHALQSADLLIHAGGFGLIVLDLCGISERSFQRVPLSFWYRCRRAVENTPAVLLVLEERAHGKTCASTAMEMEQEDTRWSGNLLDCVRYRAGARKPFHTQPFVFCANALG